MDLEVEDIFTRNNMRHEPALNGLENFPIFEFINAADGYPIDHQHGKDKTKDILRYHKAELEYHGIHYMKNRHGAATPAMNLDGLKSILYYLTGAFANRYKMYSIKTTTRYEAGDKSMHNGLDANAASSNILNQMARDAVAQEHASVGLSLAAPPELVRGALVRPVRACCAVVVLLCSCAAMLLCSYSRANMPLLTHRPAGVGRDGSWCGRRRV